MKLSPKQVESVIGSTSRQNIWEGAVRSGKTVGSLIRWVEQVADGPKGDLLMIGKTERTLIRNILNPLQEMIGERRVKWSTGTGEGKILGRRFYMMGASDERAEGKIRGLTVASAYGDEFTLWPESVYRQLLARLSVKGAKLFGTTNPDNPFHWLKTDYLDRQGDLNLASFHFEIDDNPYLDPEYVADLKREYTGVWYQRFILGLWVVAEGAIYDQEAVKRSLFDDADAPQTFDRLVVVNDYGTQNPFHALLIGVKARESWVLDEWQYSGREKQLQKTDAQYSKALREWLGHEWDMARGQWIVGNGKLITKTICDPAASSMLAQYRLDGWPHVTPAKNDVDEGLRLVANRLASGKLRIHRHRCPQLLKEMAVYSWDPNAAKRGKDEPLKRDDHGPDALRYHEFTEMNQPELGALNLDFGQGASTWGAAS